MSKLKSEQKRAIVFASLFVFIVIILPIIVLSLLYVFTKFEKKITVKEKYVRYRKGGSNYNIVTTDNKIFQIDNVWFKGDFNRAEDYASIKEGETYLVKGFGKRIPFLDMYEKIYELKQANK